MRIAVEVEVAVNARARRGGPGEAAQRRFVGGAAMTRWRCLVVRAADRVGSSTHSRYPGSTLVLVGPSQAPRAGWWAALKPSKPHLETIDARQPAPLRALQAGSRAIACAGTVPDHTYEALHLQTSRGNAN